ncbi:NAD(P)-binding protein [Macrolepiota fuliginosa MF-IS2]|uniref:NAD(P)-binding protein n=1 Tax=Macrolepiota fuliginosa MF-IS2 TaxID=1400762 RepID=A0A9P5XFU0_9AGAR|nr:NAD(P)-binding protein [Macrolepiota fuliginosa MF-IS2]
MLVVPPRVWLITGASTGFGHALACHVLENGETVVATMRNPGNDTLALKYPTHTKEGKLVISKLDVTDAEEIITVFASVKEQFGRIDVVFNNAGCTQAVGEVEQVPEALGRNLFDTNFWGAANVSKAAVRHFRENTPPGGRLLQISSGAALQGIPGTAYYSASKAALEVFTEALSQEVDPKWNIKISVLEPGPFNTKAINQNLAILPPHPAYIDPNLGTNVSRKWMTPDKLALVAGNVSKGVSFFYRLSMLDNPPFRLPLHPRVLERARHHIQTIQTGVDEYGSWSDEIF